MIEPAMFTHTDAEGDALVIRDGGSRGALVDMVNVDGNDGVYVNADEAPEVALALLKTAGIEPNEDGNPLEVAALFLAQAVAELAEALEESGLEDEALALLRAATGEHFVELPGMAREFWLNAARKARELHAPAPEKAPEPRFSVRIAKGRPGTYWIVYDAEKDRVYPFGHGGESSARKALRELNSGAPNLYFSEPNNARFV